MPPIHETSNFHKTVVRFDVPGYCLGANIKRKLTHEVPEGRHFGNNKIHCKKKSRRDDIFACNLNIEGNIVPPELKTGVRFVYYQNAVPPGLEKQRE